MSKLIDLTGKKFSRLTVLNIGVKKGDRVYWVCKCDCGTIKEIMGHSLKRGVTKSCGCLKIETCSLNVVKTIPIAWEVDEKTGCWNCISHKMSDKGYPVMNRNGEGSHVHRYLYQEKYGRLPKDIQVRHKCDNRQCINLEHLEIGTNYDNVQDKIKRGRAFYGIPAKGEKNYRAKLTDAQAYEILNDNVSKNVDLAKLYNVGCTTISEIRRRKKWRHIPLETNIVIRIN